MKLRIQVFLIESFIGLLGLCPKWMLTRIATILRVLLYPFTKKDREKLYRNCENILNLPRHSQFARQFCRQVFQHQIESGLESLITIRKPVSKDPIEILGLDELESTIRSLKESQKGIIVVTAHLGSWEFIARYCAIAANETFIALAKPSTSHAVTEFMDRSRGRMNAQVLWTDRKSLLKDMIKTVRSNQILGLVSDQKPEGRRGPVVKFFDRPTAFVSGPSKLSIKTKAPILTVFCMREGPWRYRIIHKVIVEPDHNEIDDVTLTQKFATEIERVIRLYPEQWVWNYKRWRFTTS